MEAGAPHIEHRGAAATDRWAGSERLLALFPRVFEAMLDRVDAGLELGRIEAVLPDGRRRVLGGRAEGPVAIVELRRWRALLRLATGGSAGWYVAWRDGDWASPDPVPLFALFMRNARSLGGTARSQGLARLVRRVTHLMRRNDRRGAKRNIEFHYDLGNDFYAAWLDPSLTYSSALFEQPGDTLEQGQARKIAAILGRLNVAAGDDVLEIGCGWGSFAESASRTGLRVHAITLSPEQQRATAARIADAGLTGVTVSRTDYRDVTGRYDAVASIEMVEAVGQDYWGEYLAAIHRALKPGGRAAIQYITIDDAIFEAYAANVDFIQRFIFPGGMLLSQSRFRALAERQGFVWADQQDFGADYAETLRRWRMSFDRAVEERRLPPTFNSDFIDLWGYYLMYCEGGFRGCGIDVSQVTLIRGE